MNSELTSEVLKHISSEYGSAFYLLDESVFEKNYKELTEAFRQYYQKFNIAYSYKTNYIPQIVKVVDRLGGYAEVVSDMEMQIALHSGVSPKRIIWNGPVKNKENVKNLLISGGTVNIDSIYEINNIREIANNHPDITFDVGVRINYDVGDGVVSRFGFDVGGKDFHEVISFIQSMPNLHLKDLQAHFAKRDPSLWSARAEGMLNTYDLLVERYGIKPERLDLGGGLFGKMPKSLRLQLGIEETSYLDYASRAAKMFSNRFSDDPKAPWLFIEPGTAVAGDCMKFVCRIETLKDVRGKTIATVMGSQKNISMTGINPPMEIVSGGGKQITVKNADIVGYTCIESDVLQKDYSGMLAIGDYVVISNCGSYSLVMKPPFILPNFPVLSIKGDKIRLVKEAESFEDLFHTYSFD